MTAGRAAAIDALQAKVTDDFLQAAGVEAPVPDAPGVIPAVGRRFYPSLELKRRFDLLALFRIGDFSGEGSAYFDPGSPWYNVAYGAWGIRSYKYDGAAWGFSLSGEPDFVEMMDVLQLDFDFLKAGALGCPADKLCFHVESLTKSVNAPWAVADVLATIPSGLHAGASSPLFGVADPAFSSGRQDYEPVAMVGRLFFRAVAPRLTLAWGGLCPATPGGEELLEKIVGAMSRHYVK